MQVDKVEASWDQTKNKWLLRIQTGEEVIRRYCDASKNADETAIRAIAEQTLQDEGYDRDLKQLTIRR